MARGDQLGRQWSILQTLIVSKRGKSVAELAAELECNPRTVYRDLKALEIKKSDVHRRRLYEESRWARMRSLGAIEKALRAHNLVMTWPGPEQIVYVRSSDITEAMAKAGRPAEPDRAPMQRVAMND